MRHQTSANAGLSFPSSLVFQQACWLSPPPVVPRGRNRPQGRQVVFALARHLQLRPLEGGHDRRSDPRHDQVYLLLPTRAKVSLRPALSFSLMLLPLPQLGQRPLNSFASAV